MGNFTPPPKKKTAIDNTKLGLSAPCPTAEGKWSSLRWGLNNNNPFIVVYTGDPNDDTPATPNGRIKAELDLPMVMMIFDLLERAITEENGWKMCVETLNFIFPGGRRSEKPVITTNIWVGKDKEGSIFISVIDAQRKDRPVIKFELAPSSYWFHINSRTGETISKQEASVAWTKGYIDLLRNLYYNLAVTEYTPPKPKDGGNGGGNNSNRGGGGGGNRGNYNNNNSGGNNNNSSSGDGLDDDIPF